jgi:membrane-bound lytic murein transglycosylase F
MPIYPTTYDRYFQEFSEHFFGPAFDWRWFKAQAIAESNLNPLAVSPKGATGIMQLMPGTYAEMTQRLRYPSSKKMAALIYDPVINIQCGIGYDRRMWDIWKKEVSMERIRFMLASYNAGAGNIIKAQRKATIKYRWVSIAAVLHLVTGTDDAPETIAYVRKIEQLHGSI